MKPNRFGELETLGTIRFFGTRVRTSLFPGFQRFQVVVSMSGGSEMPETVENASNSEEISSGVHGRDTVEIDKA